MGDILVDMSQGLKKKKKKEKKKIPSGGAYNLTNASETREKNDTRALDYPWGNYGRLCVVIWLFLVKNKKKKEKNSTFSFHGPARGLNPRPPKNGKNDRFMHVPSSPARRPVQKSAALESRDGENRYLKYN